VIPISVDITSAVRNLKLRASDLGKINVTFFVRSNLVKNKAVDSKLAINLGAIDLVVERAVLE